MYFMGLNVLTAGMLGLIGIKEWDFLAHLVNKYTNMNMPSGTEWVMSKFKDTKYRFGLLSDAVGMHVGATMNAPTLTGTFAPGMQFIGDAAKFGATLGQQALSQTGMVNPPTGVELRDAWKGVTPRFNWIDRAGEALGLGSTGLNWADIEEKYTPPGMPYQDLAGRAGPVTRTEEDKFARKLGTYTTREAEEKTEYFINERSRKERASRFGDNIKTMADIITRNPTASDLMDQLEPIIQRIEKEQAYTGQQIKTALKNSLRDKMIEVDERRAHQIQRIIKSLGD
jgi:hypothetical protein